MPRRSSDPLPDFMFSSENLSQGWRGGAGTPLRVRRSAPGSTDAPLPRRSSSTSSAYVLTAVALVVAPPANQGRRGEHAHSRPSLTAVAGCLSGTRGVPAGPEDKPVHGCYFFWFLRISSGGGNRAFTRAS
jgi:hypothetical protein